LSEGTGSAFRVNVPVSGATFRISGQPPSYLKTTAESGTPGLQAFCPRCGSPIYSTTPGEGAQPIWRASASCANAASSRHAAKLVPLVAALGDRTGRAAQE
jgi:hypothetical protein